MHLKVLIAKWQPFYLGLNMLRDFYMEYNQVRLTNRFLFDCVPWISVGYNTVRYNSEIRFEATF